MMEDTREYYILLSRLTFGSRFIRVVVIYEIKYQHFFKPLHIYEPIVSSAIHLKG